LAVITELSDQECPTWDAYVQNAAHGLPQHLSGWRKVLHKTYGYETSYLMACQDKRVVGVLPLFFVRSILVGDVAMTMPGGLCADSEEVAAELISHAKEITCQARVRRLILHDTRQKWPGELVTISRHVHWIVDVRPNAEALWKRLHSNIRRQVRIARRKELSVEIDRSGQHLSAFYDVLSRCTHQMGTPLFGRNFLERIVDTFPDGFNIAMVFRKQQPIGGYFQLQMGNTVFGMWGATLREYLKLRPVYLAYWEILSYASVHGYAFLDMGRSPVGSETSKYKGQWGGVARPIYQQVIRANGDANANASNTDRIQLDSKFQLVMRLWPKLPLPVVRYLGPKLRHHVPFA
jgi:FemAB-related protein (PEP-CTERM system-associated)